MLRIEPESHAIDPFSGAPPASGTIRRARWALAAAAYAEPYAVVIAGSRGIAHRRW